MSQRILIAAACAVLALLTGCATAPTPTADTVGAVPSPTGSDQATIGPVPPVSATPSSTAPTQPPTAATPTEPTVLFHDDFTGPAGLAPDTNLWQLQVTDKWQPAPELQTYTTDPANAYLDGDGHLTVRAIATGVGWTSARLESRSLFHYGQFSARIKVPAGAGTWPAFWLLGEDNRYGWPGCGEVDVVEAPAAEKGRVFAGTHQPDEAGHAVGSGELVPTASIDVDAWHTYGLDWRPGRFDFYLDGQLTGSVTRESIEALGGVWLFDDRPQRIVLNLAIGGWGGTPGGWADQTMTVDWVRVQAGVAGYRNE